MRPGRDARSDRCRLQRTGRFFALVLSTAGGQERRGGPVHCKIGLHMDDPAELMIEECRALDANPPQSFQPADIEYYGPAGMPFDIEIGVDVSELEAGSECAPYYYD